MNREQAASILKRIFEESSWVEGKSVKLIPPKNNNALSNTFQIHIVTNGDKMIPTFIRTIAKENGLIVEQKEGFIIVYKPYPHKDMA